MTTKVSALTKEELVKHEKEFGGYNDAPPNFTEITAEQFAQSGFFSWCVDYMEYRQICVERLPWKGEKCMLAVKMFFMNNTEGFAIAHDYWAKKVRFFTFAKCFHTYVEQPNTTGWRCYHINKCSKCGHIWEVDSSD